MDDKTPAKRGPKPAADNTKVLAQIVEMVKFLNMNPQWRADDYLADNRFDTSEIHKLIGK